MTTEQTPAPLTALDAHIYEALLAISLEPAWQTTDDDAAWLAEVARRLPGLEPTMDALHGAQRRLIADGRMEYVGNKGVRGLPLPAPAEQTPAPLTAEELAAIEARANAATPGPWRACGAERGCGLVWSLPADRTVCQVQSIDGAEETVPGRPEDATFIAHARVDVPRLLATVRTQAQRIADLEAIEKSVLSELDAENEDVIIAAAYTFERLGKARAELTEIRAAVDASSGTSTLDAVRHKAWRCESYERAIDQVSVAIGRIDALTKRRDGEGFVDAVARTIADLENLLAVANEELTEIRGVVHAGEKDVTIEAVERALSRPALLERGDRVAWSDRSRRWTSERGELRSGFDDERGTVLDVKVSTHLVPRQICIEYLVEWDGEQPGRTGWQPTGNVRRAVPWSLPRGRE